MADALARRARRPRLTLLGTISGLVGALVAALLILPVGRIVADLFVVNGHLDLAPVGEAAALPGIGETVRNTAICVGAGGAGAMAVGSLIAWLNERTDARMGWLSALMPVVPLLVPPVATAIGWTFLLSPRAGLLNVGMRTLSGSGSAEGPLNVFSWPGLILLYMLELTPYVYLLVSAALRNLDPSLEQASRMSGAGPLGTLVRVTLPAIRPALASSALMMVAIGLALFSIPAIVGVNARIDVMSTRIVELLNASFPPRTGVAVALSVVVLAVIVSAWLLQSRVMRAGRYASVGGKGVRSTPVRLGVWRGPARMLLGLFVALATVLPVAGLLLVSLQTFWSATIDWGSLSLDAYRKLWLNNPRTRSGILNSVTLGLVAATIGMAIAWLLAHQNRARPSGYSRLLDGLVKLPAGLSHIVIAVGLLLTFAGPPFRLGGTLLILLIAYVIMFLPQGSIAANAAVTQVGAQLTEASRVCGAGEWRTARRVSLPLMLPGLAGGWALLFVFAMGDLTASVLLAGTTTPTAGYLLYDQYSTGSNSQVAALALLMSLASAVVVLGMLRFTQRRIGAALPGSRHDLPSMSAPSSRHPA